MTKEADDKLMQGISDAIRAESCERGHPVHPAVCLHLAAAALATVKMKAMARPAPAAGVIDRELRRQIAECADVQTAIDANRCTDGNMTQWGNERFYQGMKRGAEDLLAILALKPTMAGEPVAWQRRYRSDCRGWEMISKEFFAKLQQDKADGYDDECELRMLYASPAPSGRDPATIEACAKVAEQNGDLMEIHSPRIAKAIRALVTDERRNV